MFRYLVFVFLAGCATTLPFVGHGNQPQSDEYFVRWEDDAHQECRKHLLVDNPLNVTAVVHFDCKVEPLLLDVKVPAHMSKVVTVYGNERQDAFRETCHETGFDIIR
jgi:hypothetical protein